MIVGKKDWLKLLIAQVLVIAFATTLSANISGTVYRDYNMNSIQDAGEPGVEGIDVKAYDDAGTAVTATTDAAGVFDLATGAGDYRVEIDNMPTYLQSTASTGADATTFERPATFIESDGAVGLLIGLHNPAEYVSPEADIAMVFQANTDGTQTEAYSVRILRNDDIPGVTTGGIPTDDAYDNNGEQDAAPVKGDIVANATETGNLWGVAYDSSKENVYVSAAVRRYMAMGPMGTGGIYKINSAGDVTQFATVAGTGVITENAARDLQSVPTNPSHDPIFDEVGRTGLGDIDVSEDGTKLYTINLNTRELVIIDIVTGNTLSTHLVGNPFGMGGAATCLNTDTVPWGIGQKDGKVYVGSVCTTSLAAGAAISEFDGAAFTAFHQTPLSGQGENSVDGTNKPADDARWLPWYTTATDLFHNPGGSFRMSYPSPILSDIVFDENDGIILGLIDRTAMQAGHDNYAPDPTDTTIYRYDSSGDILRVCKVAGAYFNEGHENCPQQPARTTPPTNYTDYPEYFGGDEWNPYHGENALGGLAYQQGTDRLLATSFDPVERGYDGVNNNHSQSGIEWLDTAGGERTSGIRMAGGGDLRFQYNGKAGGMGDVEYMNAPAPIEIGNFVWFDEDRDGIQDPSELAIAGVTVNLYEAGVLVGTATTDANGHYYFGGPENTSMTNPLKPETAYELKIALDDNTLEGKAPTAQDQGTDVHDSDGDNGVIDPSASTIQYTTGTAGQNNHDLDFGFIEPAKMSIGSFVWIDADKNGIQDIGETPVEGAVVTLLMDDGTGNYEAVPGKTMTTLADGLYYFDELAEGDYKVQVVPPAGLVPTPIQNTFDNNDTANDSNIKDSDEATRTYTSAIFNLATDAEPTEAGFMPGDDADDADELNGNMTIDFGFVPVVSIGSTVFYDNDDNGKHDVGEDAIVGVTVNLYLDADGNGVPDGAAIKTMQTDNDGNYFFDNLEPGNYIVGVVPPADAPTSSTDRAGITEIDNQIDGDDNGIQATSGAEALSPSIELGVGDEPEDALETAQGGDQETGPDANGDMTVDFGFVPVVSIGSLVWNDVNNNGTQDDGELGINGATVELFDSNGDPVTTDANGNPVTPITTVADGKYCFCNLPEGDYTVKVTPPAGYTQSTTQQPNANTNLVNDSNIATDNLDGSYTSNLVELRFKNEPTGENSDITGSDTGCGCAVADDSSNATVDFGFYRPQVSLGSVVWIDTNDNGTQDTDEAGINGATVQLLDENGTPVTTDANGNPIVIATTGPNGTYYFGNLPEGNYTVKVTPPGGYVPSTTQVANPNFDIPGDSNIASNNGDGSYTSGVIELTNNGEPEGAAEVSSLPNNGDDADDIATPLDDNTDNNGNMTFDFGFVPVVSIGSLIWNDANDNGIQDAGEEGIKGALVTLIDPLTGDPVAGVDTQTTGDDGKYCFCGLPEGDYQVQVVMPQGYSPSAIQNTEDNNDTVNDSNIATQDLLTHTFTSGTFTLSNDGEPTGENSDIADSETGCCTDDDNSNSTVDFGFKAVFDLALTKTLAEGQATTIAPGDTVVFTITVYNQGTIEATDIAVVDYIPEGLTLNDADWTVAGDIATLNTPIATLAAGASTTVDITLTVNADFQGVSITNNAEIADANNSLGIPDIDSTPSTEDGSIPDPEDDDVDNKTGGDDYDPASVTVTQIFDLALIKTLADGQESIVAPGTDVTFTITVINQGTLDATDVAVVDYIPTGLALNDSDWTLAGENATLNIPIPELAVGASVSVDITFTVDAAFDGEFIRNFAEIADASNIPQQPDVDSTPDADDSNDGTPTDDEVNNENDDEDDHDYAEISTYYHIGTHFWIDNDNNGQFDEGETPIPGALVELFDANGTLVGTTETNATGGYGFDVPAGEYYVKFHIPQEFKDLGYVFSDQRENMENADNVSIAGADGITRRVEVGPDADPRYAYENLTLDAGINCPCDDIVSDSGDALSTLALLLMILGTTLTALFFIRREELRV